MIKPIYLKRILSLVIDLVFNSIVAIALIMLSAEFVREIKFIYVLALVHLFNTSVVLLATRRVTAGQLMMKLSISSVDVRLGKLLLRNAIFCLFFFGAVINTMVLILFLLGLMWMFFSQKHQTLWDELTATSIS